MVQTHLLYKNTGLFQNIKFRYSKKVERMSFMRDDVEISIFPLLTIARISLDVNKIKRQSEAW